MVAVGTAPPKAFVFFHEYRRAIMPACLIGLGANEGNRQATLDAAVAELRRQSQITVGAISTWRETAPIGGPQGQADFLNGALLVETSLSPNALLACLQAIENRLGRQRTERWGSRAIDLDILLYDELVVDTPSLILPHPRMAWRRFVLEPAAEVAGSTVHPTMGWTMARLLEHLDSAQPYVAIAGLIAVGKTHLAERIARAIPARLLAERPDWDRLNAFYADPAGFGWEMELEFLRQRARMLAADAMAGSATRWMVSDFWFDQSAAFAHTWLSAEQLPAFLERYEDLRRDVLRPKLIVLLDSPADVLLDRVRQRGRACERRLTREQLDRIRRAVREQADRPKLGPVLRVDNDDREAVFAEVLAAVRGME